MPRPKRGWIAAHLVVILLFVVTVASYYRRGFGFTEFLHLPVDHQDEYELPAVRSVPHVENQDGGYDGQFYARLALDPLLKDPAIDRTLDLPGYRARRILFSWTAYLAGLGRPTWVLEAFALQNVVVWLLFARILLIWFPIGSGRSFGLWAACLLTHGMLSSVSNALLDAPSALLLTLAGLSSEHGRPWLTSVVLGIAGLGRETNLLGSTMLMRFAGPSPRQILRLIGWLVIAVAPAALWLDYLRSIYRSGAFATAGVMTTPLTGFVWKLSTILRDVRASGLTAGAIFDMCVVVAFVLQVGYVVWLAFSTWRDRSPWLLLAISFGALAVFAHRDVWAGSPAAITRVTLPMTLAFNVLARRASWPTLVFGNATVLPGLMSFVFRIYK